MAQKKLKISAPGRICLFGEHQDYLGLPVIACAINKRLWIEGERRQDNLFNVILKDTNEHRTINPNERIEYENKRDYVLSSVNLSRKKGLNFRYGYDIEVNSEIPINAGVSSSSALIVAWLKFLFDSQIPDSLEVSFQSFGTLEELAELAYDAEVREFGEAGGKMDHYTLSLGGMIYINTQDPIRVERFDSFKVLSTDDSLGDFVLGNSLEKKNTIDVLKNLKKEVKEGFNYLEEKTNFNRYSSSIEDTDFSILPKKLQDKIRATLTNRDITQKARYILQNERLDDKEKNYLGDLLNLHQEQLKILGVSTSKLDSLIQASLNSGALGAKITGSGGGGCMFAYCPEKQEEVKNAIEKKGGRAHIIKPDFGVWFHTGKNYYGK